MTVRLHRLFSPLRPVFRRMQGAMLERRIPRLRAGSGSFKDFVDVGRWLAERQRLQEVEDIVEIGLARFPDAVELLVESAWNAQKAGRPIEAKVRWERVRDRQPELAVAWCGIAANARVLSKTDEASATIAEALRRFPEDINVAVEAASVADRNGAYGESVVMWQRLVRSAPSNAGYHVAFANALVRLGRYDEAETAIAAAMSRFSRHPGRQDLLAIKGTLAMAREDWEGAIAIWQEFRSQYPDNAAGWENLGRTLAAKQLAEVEVGQQSLPVIRPVEVVRVEDEAIRALLLGFESVGNDCEFGMVQRRYGAEPLGLLRWNYVPLPALMSALAARLDGMGSVEHTELWLSGDNEYFVQDKRWGLGMHTFKTKDQIDKAVFFPKICQRVAYLRDKFLADLQGGEKIVVYKSKDIRLDDVLSLHAKFRALGEVRLLCVKPATADPAQAPLLGKAGEVFRVADDLHVGFVDRLGGVNGYWDIAFDDWISICRNVQTAPRLMTAPVEA